MVAEGLEAATLALLGRQPLDLLVLMVIGIELELLLIEYGIRILVETHHVYQLVEQLEFIQLDRLVLLEAKLGHSGEAAPMGLSRTSRADSVLPLPHLRELVQMAIVIDQGLALQAHGGQLLVGQTVDLVETGQGLILQVATAGELEFSRLGIGLGFGLVARLLGHLLWC